METGHIFRKFFALQRYLGDNLHKQVDLGIESALKPVVREKILKPILQLNTFTHGTVLSKDCRDEHGQA